MVESPNKKSYGSMYTVRWRRNRELSRKSVAERKRREAAARANGNGNGNGGDDQGWADGGEQSALGGRGNRDELGEKEVDNGSKKRKGGGGGAKGGGKAALSYSNAGYHSSLAATATLSSEYSPDEDGEGEQNDHHGGFSPLSCHSTRLIFLVVGISC